MMPEVVRFLGGLAYEPEVLKVLDTVRVTDKETWPRVLMTAALTRLADTFRPVHPDNKVASGEVLMRVWGVSK